MSLSVGRLAAKSRTDAGRESVRCGLNLHDVGLARHFDELRALYGDVFVLVGTCPPPPPPPLP
jgi:hypothetical protein